MIIDTHCHLYYDELKNDFDDVLKRAEDTGIERIIVPAVDLKTSLEIIEMTEKYEMIYALVGIHPTEVKHTPESDLEKISNLIKSNKVVGIGETGLDYYWDKTGIEKQKTFFKEQIELAIKTNKPVVIHTRESIEDAIEIITENYNSSLGGQFHCFGGTIEQTKKILDFEGFYISFCGNITYKNNKDSEIVEIVPLDRLLSETDSPFLTPVPNRGKRNEPANIVYTILKISEIKNIKPEILKAGLYENALKLFFKN
ncbi:MAG TPA: hydrolase TatD [Bacteroidetes bacterium]|nr:hydrolase TatD [Bacteroidota bacterium]